MANFTSPTLAPRLLILPGACLIALAVFGQIGGAPGAALNLTGGLCGLAGPGWFPVARRRAAQSSKSSPISR